ncbi:ABC transporter ATP-binding protein [Pseudaeromonas pectinilytica]|nr:ABC transporter ATP-binding protein [Aeromonadaceae bacterium]MBP8772006.1 ABC transporter ATP-binding protein [Aeromonadaceae bacterium]
MAIFSLHQAYLSYSDAPLLDHIDLQIEPGERLCLVGRNGAGKSTLLKVIAGDLPLDDGRRIHLQDLQIARLEQDPPQSSQETVFDYVANGLSGVGNLLQRYHVQSIAVAHDPSEQNIRVLSRLQEELDHLNGWQFDMRIRQVLSMLKLDPEASLQQLSGGWLRKVAFARALAGDPDLLLLDEPTNHLDIEAIDWLESFLKEFRGAIVFISHDREFIHALATRIVDLDRGQVSSWPGNYDQYLEGKEEALRVESLQQAEFDKKLAQEETWIRQGIKARRTRNEGRVRALKALRNERQARREVQGTARLQVDEAQRSGKLVFEAEHLGYDIDGRTLIQDFTFQVLRGDKIALIGPNGCGKTTLIKLLLGDLTPQRGTLRCGTKLDVAYFDQYRQQLDPDKTVVDNLAEGRSEVEVAGRRRHVLGYLQDFLFEPKRALTPVRALSGGEKNRLLLARLFLKPCNLLILDEPTNDLDIETLELLEDLLAEYQATLLLVSHDRRFIDNTVTHSWFFEGDGRITEYVGGYADLQALRQQMKPTELVSKASKEPEPVTPVAKKSRKMSYKLQLELEALPAKLEALEQRLTAYQEQVNSAEFFTQDSVQTQKVLAELQACEDELETAFLRWEELEAMKQED